MICRDTYTQPPTPSAYSQISNNWIGLESIKIIQFCLKIWFLWRLLHPSVCKGFDGWVKGWCHVKSLKISGAAPHQGHPAVFPSKNHKSADEKRRIKRLKRQYVPLGATNGNRGTRPSESETDSIRDRRNPCISSQKTLPLSGWLWLPLSLPEPHHPLLTWLRNLIGITHCRDWLQILFPCPAPTSPPDFPLETIGTQLGTLFPVTPGLSPNQSFEGGVTEDLPVVEALSPEERTGPLLQPTGHSEENQATVPIFRKQHPPTTTMKSPQKQITRPAILHSINKPTMQCLARHKVLAIHTSHPAADGFLCQVSARHFKRPWGLSNYDWCPDVLWGGHRSTFARFDRKGQGLHHSLQMYYSMTDLQLAHYLSGALDSLIPTCTKEAHQDLISKDSIHLITHDVQTGVGSGPNPAMQPSPTMGPLYEGPMGQSPSPAFALNRGSPVIRYHAILTLIPMWIM